MIQADTCFNNMLASSVRHLVARVEVYENGNQTILNTFTYNDRLISLTVERVGEATKFFGYGICQRLNVKIMDPNRELDINTGHNLEVVFGTDCNYIYTCPIFYVSEVHRNENTNELSITAYDAIYKATAHQVSEIELEEPYNIEQYATAIANFLGLPMSIIGANEAFATVYGSGANFAGTETMREALDAIAEATQTIYYIDSEWRLTFRRLDREAEPVYSITKEDYFTLDSGENRRLATICHATELGDNIHASLEVSGSTQYVRNNPFWTMREDVGNMVDAALAAVGGLTINQFECSWRGNFLLEIGDKIALTTKDGGKVVSYVLDDVITYNGSYSQKTRWHYENDDTETESNPTSLGDMLKLTYANVDKANQKIELAVRDLENTKQELADLALTGEKITASVEEIKTINEENQLQLEDEITELHKRVDATMTSENIKFTIQQELTQNGAGKVITNTGFTFDDEGLTISKTGTEMTTQITEDGMTVYKDNTAMLVANNVGVEAVNLHATTYLIIGTNSRFEDYDGNRTGCFWLGGEN